MRVTMTPSRTMLAGVLLLLGSGVAWAGSQSETQLSPTDLVRAVIRNELKNSDAPDIRWKYLLNKEAGGKQETREVVETRSGSLDRLVTIAGRPLTEAEQRAEGDRIFRLSHSLEEQRKLEESHRKDVEQCNQFLRMIPDAFVFESGGQGGGLIQLIFKPNPQFQPPSREAKIVHAMAGEIWIDSKQQRLVSIRAQIVNEVKFAGGLLGHLEKGGQFMLKRSEIAPGHWELTEMVVNLRGKVLLFKTVSAQQKELHTKFQPVPEDLSPADAAGILLQQTLVAAKR